MNSGVSSRARPECIPGYPVDGGRNELRGIPPRAGGAPPQRALGEHAEPNGPAVPAVRQLGWDVREYPGRVSSRKVTGMRLRGLCALVVALCFFPAHGQATAATALPPVLVAFTQSSNVFFFNLKTGARTVVTTKGRDNGKGASYPWYGWSPDGKYLALLRINNGADAKVPQNLLILDRSGTVLQTLVGGAGDFYPGWAVDADQVAYIADAGYDHGHAYFDVEAADIKGHITRLWRSSNAQFCGIGEGAALRSPLALAVVGGLFSSTILIS